MLKQENYPEVYWGAQCNHKDPSKWKKKWESERCRYRRHHSDTMWEGLGPPLMALKMGEEKSTETGKDKETFPYSASKKKERNSDDTLLLAHWELCWTYTEFQDNECLLF